MNYFKMLRSFGRWTLPHLDRKKVTCSKQEQESLDLLHEKTTRVMVDGVARYATPLLRKGGIPNLQVPIKAVTTLLKGTEQRLERDPQRAAAYQEEIRKLELDGYAMKLTPEEVKNSAESWFIPHHMVQHNGKNRVVFNCSFAYKGISLNDFLLPEPTLGPSLLGILLRFREHPVAISGDIKAMFHQVRLLPEDKCLFRVCMA